MLELEALHLILHFVPLVKGLKLAVQGLALRGLALTIKFGEEGLHGISKKVCCHPLVHCMQPVEAEDSVRHSLHTEDGRDLLAQLFLSVYKLQSAEPLVSPLSSSVCISHLQAGGQGTEYMVWFMSAVTLYDVSGHVSGS